MRGYFFLYKKTAVNWKVFTTALSFNHLISQKRLIQISVFFFFLHNHKCLTPMKIDKHKYKELILALCSLYRLNYFEFVKPSKSPEYIKVRAVLIYYFKQQKFTNKQISPIVKLDHSNVSRNYLFAKSRILTTKRGMYILKNIEMLIFKQSIGVGTALEQIMRDNISKK